MRQEFNLIDEPWIPCVSLDGQVRELSLRDALRSAHEQRDIGGDSALATAALYRLLLAILHRVFGPPGYDAWHALWQAQRLDATAIDRYLSQWRERFDLFHPERPFYQAGDPRVTPKSVVRLVLDAASGNNATLFDHHTESDGMALTPAASARALLVAQAFGLAGLSGLEQKFTDGPCARGIIFLVHGATLFETLLLNLIRYPDDRAMPITGGDRPAWEMDDPYDGNRQTPLGYLDYLTWQNRRVLLLPSTEGGRPVVREVTMAPGLRLAEGVLDAMKHYTVRDEKRGPQPLRFREGRALWRDSSVLFRLQASDQRPPWALDWVYDLSENGCVDPVVARRFLALGMANDQAKVEFFRTEQMPISLSYLTDERAIAHLDNALQMAEGVRNQLWGATHTMAVLAISPDTDQDGAIGKGPDEARALIEHWPVEQAYWWQLEAPFYATMATIPTEPDLALSQWSATLRRVAWDALDSVARTLERDMRRVKAVVRARGQLAAGLAKALPALA